MAKRMIKQISFSDYEEDIYNYLTEQPNASALLKKLTYAYMHGLIELPDADKPKEKKAKKKNKITHNPPTTSAKKQEEKSKEEKNEEDMRRDYYNQLPF